MGKLFPPLPFHFESNNFSSTYTKISTTFYIRNTFLSACKTVHCTCIYEYIHPGQNEGSDRKKAERNLHDTQGSQIAGSKCCKKS